MCLRGVGVFVFGQALMPVYETIIILTYPYISVGSSFNSCDYAASYTGSSIREDNMETCPNFIMNNSSCILLASRKCDGHSVERLRTILTLIVTGIYRLFSQCGEEYVPFV